MIIAHHKAVWYIIGVNLIYVLEAVSCNLGASFMDDDKKRIVMIVLIVGCLALAGGITFYQFSGGGTGYASNETIYLKCLNKSCGEIKETTSKELYEGINSEQYSPMQVGPMRFDCPKCGKRSMFIAEKCSKCETVFVPNPRATRDYPDRCPNPDCKYSAMEEESKQR